MINFDQEFGELDQMLEAQNKRQNMAKAAQEKADKIKEAAIKEEEASVEAAKRINDARNKYKEAKEARDAISDLMDNEEKNTNNRNSNTNNSTNNNNTNNNSNGNQKKSITWLLTGALVLSLIGNGIGFSLVKKSKTGTVKSANASASLIGKNDNYQYNYGENVVTASNDETLGNYVPLTKEAFEELCTKAIIKFRDNGLVASEEEIIKFVAVFNIDKLKQDNQELIRELMGTQTVEEFFADAVRVSDTILNYESKVMFSQDATGTFINPEWRQYYWDLGHDHSLKRQFCPNTDLIMSIADFTFDETQQKLIRDFEARRNEILKVEDIETRNKMIQKLFEDMVDPSCEFRLFEDSSKYFVLRHCIADLELYYCRDYIADKTTIDGVAYESLVRWIAPYGSTQEQYDLSIMSGTKRSMMESLKKCTLSNNGIVLTR